MLKAILRQEQRSMNERCPHCEGRLIEKHHETVTEREKTIVFVYFRCVRCGKWTKRESEPYENSERG